MGTKNFFHKSSFQPSGLNLEARAGAAGGYASKGFSSGAQKDIGVAQALVKSGMRATPKTAATNAPGPKRT